MDEGRTGPRSGPGEWVEEELDLLRYGAMLWRRRWLVAALCLVAVATALAATVRAPRVYEVTTTLLVPREGGGGGLLSGLAASGLLQQLPGLSLPSLTPNRDMLVSILKSRTIAEAVVERFGLRRRYGARYLEDAVARLGGSTSVVASREGVIVLRVQDTDARLAAEMANFYVDELDRLVGRFGTGAAGRQRVFVSEQLARARTTLAGAEEALRQFQERNRAVVLQDQTRGAIEAAARLRGEIMATEVQLEVVRNFATDANPEVVNLRRRLEGLRRQLAQMNVGDGLPRSQAPLTREPSDFAVPFARVPELGLELARLTRDVKVHETLVTLLTQQLEEARMMEARDAPVVQVLDRAVPGERPIRPRPLLSLVLAGGLGLGAGLALAVVVDGLERRRRRPAAA